MTTETPKPRTLLEPVAYRCMLRLPAAARFAENARPAIDDALVEAYALGAASRASPEEGRLREEDKARERLLYGVMWQARTEKQCPVPNCHAGMLREATGLDSVSCPVCDGTITVENYLRSIPPRSPTEPADPSPEPKGCELADGHPSKTAPPLANPDAWPIVMVLERLSDAADHLLRGHDCDAHGHEGVLYAAQAARMHVERLRAPSPESGTAGGCPYGECGDSPGTTGAFCTGCRIDMEIAKAAPVPGATTGACANPYHGTGCEGRESECYTIRTAGGATTGDAAPLGGIVLGIVAEPAPLPCGCRGLCDGSCGSGRSPSPTNGGAE